MLKPDGRGMTVLLGALIAIAPLAMDIYLASMPSMTRALAATPEEVQLTLSLYMYGWGLAQLFVGPLADRHGRRPALIAGLTLFVGASIVCALSRSVETLNAARVIQALGMATAAVVPRAIVRDLHSGERAARMLSLMGMVLGIAPVVAPILGAHLHVWFGWQANFIFVACYGAVALVFVARGLPETLRTRDARATHPRTMLANYARALRSPRYTGYLLVAAFASAGLFAFLAGSSFIFVSVMGAGERGFSFLFASVMLGNITGAALGSRLVTRMGIDALIDRSLWLMLVAGAALAAGAWAKVETPLAVVVPMFVFMVSFMTTMPQATAGALSPFPDIAGSAASLLSFCQFLCASTAALVVGLTYDGTARPMATTIGVATLLAFLAFRTLVPRPARRASATPAK